MSRHRSATGRSPAQDRALQLLRAGTPLLDTATAVGVGTATIKRWARSAGVSVPTVTLEERAQRQARHDGQRGARLAYEIGITAPKARRS